MEKITEIRFETFKGVLALMLMVLFLVISSSSVQLLGRTIPDFELTTFRCVTGLVFFALVSLCKRQWPLVPRSEVPVTLCYGISNFAMSFTLYVAASIIPLASAQSIQITSGLASGLVLFAIFCKEKMAVKRISFVLLCIIGVILVIQPQFIFKICKENKMSPDENSTIVIKENENGTMETEMETKTKKRSIHLVVIGYTLPIVTGFALSSDVVLVKRFPYLKKSLLEVAFWSLILSTSFSAVAMVIFENPVLITTLFEASMIAAHCISYVFAWPLAVYGAAKVEGNVYNLIYCTIVVFMLVPQYTVLSSILPGNRNWIEIVGVVLVLFGSSLGSIWELCHKRE